MKIENIFRTIPGFQNIVLDTILFESKYPVMFTCKNEGDVYLFICCLVTADTVEWIGTKTTYGNLVALLENKVTIREAFLKVTDNKIIVKYNGKNVEYKIEKGSKIQDHLLPAADEYMDAEEDEYTEEIKEFKKRDRNIEYVITPRSNRLLVFHYKGQSRLVMDDDFSMNLDMMKYETGKIHKLEVAWI